MVGTSFPYIEFYPKPGQARGVQIDLDPARIGLRYPVEVGLVGDSRRTLQALLPLLERNEDRGFLEKAQEGMQEWRALMEERGTRDGQADEAAGGRLGARQAAARRRHRLLRLGHDHHLVRPADPGPARADALAAPAPWPRWPTACPTRSPPRSPIPDRQCVAFVGDGGFSMLMAEFATAVKYELPIKVVVIKNNTLGQIKWEQMVFLGNPEYGCDLQPIDFAAFARACGGTGFTIEDPAAVRRRPRRGAGARPGRCVVEAVVDPFEPPMPPKVTVEAGGEVRRVAGPGRAEPREDRPDGAGGQGARADLSDGWSRRS